MESTMHGMSGTSSILLISALYELCRELCRLFSSPPFMNFVASFVANFVGSVPFSAIVPQKLTTKFDGMATKLATKLATKFPWNAAMARWPSLLAA
jgi:hypothetical protein